MNLILSKMFVNRFLTDQPCSVSNNRAIETKNSFLFHYLDHLLLIPET